MIDFQLLYIICVPVSFMLMLSIVTHLTNRITVANALFAALISAIPYGNFFVCIAMVLLWIVIFFTKNPIQKFLSKELYRRMND